MERYNLFFKKGQLRSLQAISNEEGLSVSELIRRAVDGFLLVHGRQKIPLVPLTPENSAQQERMMRLIGLQ